MEGGWRGDGGAHSKNNQIHIRCVVSVGAGGGGAELITNARFSLKLLMETNRLNVPGGGTLLLTLSLPSDVDGEHLPPPTHTQTHTRQRKHTQQTVPTTTDGSVMTQRAVEAAVPAATPSPGALSSSLCAGGVTPSSSIHQSERDRV